MNKRATLADVAREAGVSMMSVSRAINNKEGISAATRDRILAVAERIGYRPSGVARALATNRSCTLGLVIPDVANPFFAQIAKGVEDGAHQAGYNVFLVNTDEDIQREEDDLDSLLEKQIDGLILCSSRLPTQDLLAYIQRFPACVLINRELDSLPMLCASINVDDRRGARLAIEHLLSHGHKHIGFIAGPTGSTSAQRRLEGVQQALANSQATLISQTASNPDIKGGHQATRALLQEHPGVDAIIAFNDMVAFGVYQACDELGKRIPEDIAVIGFDDIPLAALMKPSLSSVRIDKRALGRQAVETLIALIDDDAESIQRQQRIASRLILRQSTRN